MAATQVRKKKPFTRMTAEELAEATKEFDRAELPDNVGEPMTPEQLDEWSSGKRGRGRPRKGLGAVNVLISFERGLLERADALASGRGIGRSALVAEALESLIDRKSRLKGPRAAG